MIADSIDLRPPGRRGGNYLPFAVLAMWMVILLGRHERRFLDTYQRTIYPSTSVDIVAAFVMAYGR